MTLDTIIDLAFYPTFYSNRLKNKQFQKVKTFFIMLFDSIGQNASKRVVQQSWRLASRFTHKKIMQANRQRDTVLNYNTLSGLLITINCQQ